MSSDWGEHLRLSLFGESHGPAVGVVMDGLPPGVPLDETRIRRDLSRRAPSDAVYSTTRRETDEYRILSGVKDNHLTGTPLCAVFENADAKPSEYGELLRPGHADFTGHVRYEGFAPSEGGGHFSGRLTAPLVFAGAVAKAALTARGVFVGAHVCSIGGICDTAPDVVCADALEEVAGRALPVFDAATGERMLEAVAAAGERGDSLGGAVQCFALGVPAGIGSPMFGGLENVIASLVFGIPAVRGVEFGAGFAAAEMTGSGHNDCFAAENGSIVTRTNRHGGVLGGISSGMPIVLRVAFKPTPTIRLPQDTVDASGKAGVLCSDGRHDACIAPRAVPAVEAAVACAILDRLLERRGYSNWI